MKKKQLFGIVVKIGIIIGVVIVFILINEQITDNNRISFEPIKDSNKFAYRIEDISIEGNDLVIKGWFFELMKVRNEEVENANAKQYGVLLYDVNSEEKIDLDGNVKPRKGIGLDVSYTKRTDVDEYFSCEYDYSNCGFIARIDQSNIDLKNGEYQIIIKPDKEGTKGILCADYIQNGELKYISSNEKVLLDVRGTDLEKIIENGNCLMSSPENSVYVYQYEDRLYWIADENFYFEEDGGTYIQYQIDTTQYTMLPENSIKDGIYWANLGGFFESYEITETIDCGKYRVSVRDIPKDFSVYWICTGYYTNGKWVWMKNFRVN